MKIEITWNKSDGTTPVVEFDTKPNDPHKNDEEMQVHKAWAGAQAYFHEKFGEAPKQDQLSMKIVRD